MHSKTYPLFFLTPYITLYALYYTKLPTFQSNLAFLSHFIRDDHSTNFHRIIHATNYPCDECSATNFLATNFLATNFLATNFLARNYPCDESSATNLPATNFLATNFPYTSVDKGRKVNWTKEEEYALIEAIQDAGDILRGTGQCAEINKKKTRLWNNVMRKINSIHGNNRDVKYIKKKWNNLKGSAKARVDSSRREARRTGGGINEAGEVEDAYILILTPIGNYRHL